MLHLVFKGLRIGNLFEAFEKKFFINAKTLIQIIPTYFHDIVVNFILKKN